MGHWLQTPPGRYLLDWEQGHLDHAVADAFGFHALQLGLPDVPSLRANRMPHRWVAHDAAHVPPVAPLATAPAPAGDADPTDVRPQAAIALVCEFDALPFPDASIDLVALPHSLEFAHDPHQMLREVARVLRPEGRVVITGFNPASLWGLRQRLARVRLGIGLGRGQAYLPREGDFIGYWRLRDWLRLLGFQIESGQFGCWRPPLSTPHWLDRFAWMDRVGERWWPVLGAAYLLVGVKRVRGMRLVGLARQARRQVPVRTVAASPRALHEQRADGTLPARAESTPRTAPAEAQT